MQISKIPPYFVSQTPLPIVFGATPGDDDHIPGASGGGGEGDSFNHSGEETDN